MPTESRWIAEALRATRVERSPTLQSLWRGYGEIYRVALVGGRAPTAIVKSVRPPPRAGDDPAHARKCASYDVELAFYEIFARHTTPACRVPRLLAARKEGDRWLLVLEDLDAAGFHARRRRSPSAADRDRCVAWLAAFHGRFLGVEPRRLWPRGTYWDLDKRRDELAKIEDPALRAAAPALDAALNGCVFQTLVHGDAKLANFCFGEAGVAAVDFQWVGRGCGVRDLAYLASCCWDDDLEAHEPALLDAYFGHLRAALSGTPVDVAALEAEWRAAYPIAAADFHRFYAGWAPESYRRDAQAQRAVRAALEG